MNAAEAIIAYCDQQKLARPVREYKFHPSRRWRFDLAWLRPVKFALEIEGGIWAGGRHNHPTGFLKDIEKYNAAALLGWLVFRTTPQLIKSGEVFALLDAIAGRREEP